MIHETIGQVGHMLVIASFVSALLATFSYFKASQATEVSGKDWIQTARTLFIIHLLLVIGVASSLFVIIYQHYFEYHYAFTHSSLQLPTMFMISCYWEGQEGSFLLWIFWQAILGVILMIKNPIGRLPS